MALEEFIIEPSQVPKEPFSNVVGQDSLTRFDKPKQGGKKRRNKNRNKNKNSAASSQGKNQEKRKGNNPSNRKRNRKPQKNG